MTAAAAFLLPNDRTSDLLFAELTQILKQFDALPRAVQDAVNSVVESLLHDISTTDAEVAQLNVLLERHAQRSNEWREQPRSSSSQKRTQYSKRVRVALSQSS